MTGPLYRIGGFCSRHHWVVIAAWVLAVVALALGSRAVGEQNSDNLSLPGTGSTEAQDLLKAKLPKQAYGTNPVVLEAAKGKLTDSANSKAVGATVKSLKKEPGVIRAVSPLSKKGAAALSKDKQIGYISVTLSEGPADLTKEDAENIIDGTSPATDAGLTVATGGYLGQAVSKADTESSEAVGLAAAVVILLFAFGTATAMLLPIVSAVLGLVASLALIGFLGHAVEVPTVAPTLATMIGLGVGIDYALFIVTRHKLQLNDGMDVGESIARATATAGGAVFFAGGTVVIALASLLASGIPFVGTMGYSAAVAVVVAVLAAITLLPALLGALGLRINSLRVKLGRTHPDDHQAHGWARWARGVVGRPWRSLTAAVAVLVVLAVPVLDLHLGASDNGMLPKDTTARQAYDLITEGFGPGANGPLLVSATLGKPAKPDQKQLNDIENKQKQQKQQETQKQQQVQKQAEPQQKKLDQKKKQAESPATDSRLTKLENAIAKDPDIKAVSPATVDPKGTAAVFTAIPKTAPSDRATEDLVKRLRADVIPKATKGSDVAANVGGQTAAYIDLAGRISDKLPQMIAIVVGLSCIVLMLAFRSILLPAKAAVANLLSVAAAYGVVTFVFQEGHGATLLGLDGAVPIASYVPLLMFAILFGLSMDYEVFLLTQIQEHYKKDGEPHEAVVRGLASTGRVITSAALIMVFVFSSFVLNGNAVVKQFGIGLAAAIAIDATIVRCLAVPAAMALFGRAAWWLPRPVDRAMPEISIEGEDYFDERDKRQSEPDRPPVPAGA